MTCSTSQLASQRCLADVLDLIPDAVVVVAAANGVISTANERAERLFGYRRGDLVGAPIAPRLLSDWHRPAMAWRQAGLDDSAAHEAMECLETVARRRDGVELLVEVNLRAASLAEGTLVVNVIRDVTARRTAVSELQVSNASLKATDQAKDRFLATLGHEMRTPLNAIIGFTSLVLERHHSSLSNDQARHLEIVRNCGEHLLALSNDLLEVGQIAAGKATLHPEAMDLGALVRELHDALKPLAAAKGLCFETALDADSLPLHADRRALRQILLNLIGNAIKYTDHGSVTVRASRADASLRLSVRDTGIGIRWGDRDKLFQEFTQLGQREGPRGGAGLGLHLCARIAQLMGAHIEVQSEPGCGSEFTLVVPLLAA